MSEEEKAELTELYENSEWWHNRFKAVQRDYEKLQQQVKDYEKRFKVIKKIVEDNIFEDLDNLSYCVMLSTISSVCDGKAGFLSILGEKENESR